jgi:predicted nuclease of predicted toxin-antitoxin system
LPTRVLVDECVPRPLHRDLTGFQVRSVQEMGWAGVKNGALIKLAAAEFDAIFTVDRDFGATYTGAPPVGIVILEAGTTDPNKLRPYMGAVTDALAVVRPGEIKRVGA